MKTLLFLLPLYLSGCMLPNFNRVIPENKSAHIQIVSPMYGTITIDTRVIGDTNSLAPLLTPQNPR